MNNKQELVVNDLDASCIAKKLHLLMLHRGVSETEIARSLNTSVMTIRRVISGETEDPRISTLKLIADYFDISIDALLDTNDQKPLRLMVKNAPQYIPVLNWDIFQQFKLIQEIDFERWGSWYPLITQDNFVSSAHTFALESRPSMQPRFPNGTLFIINPDEKPIDGDILLIKMKDNNELSLRELAIDSPKWQLQPIIPGSELLFFNKEQHEIVGVVVLSVLYNRR